MSRWADGFSKKLASSINAEWNSTGLEDDDVELPGGRGFCGNECSMARSDGLTEVSCHRRCRLPPGHQGNCRCRKWPNCLPEGNQVDNKAEELGCRLMAMRVTKDHAAELRHQQAGHTTFSSSCEACVVGGGRTRQHRRQEEPSNFTLHSDVSGPFETAYGPGGKKMRFAVVFALRLPLSFEKMKIPEAIVIEES